MIAFLHTSPVHVDTFERLVHQTDPSVAVEHVVNESLLTDAQQLGLDDPRVVRRVHDAMEQAASCGAPLVVCTCSTIGGVVERMPTGGRFVASRIDRAMADYAAMLGPRILLVAALQSTLAPTTLLLEQSAFSMGVDVEIEPLLIANAWPHFLDGDRAAYIETIAAGICAAQPVAHVIVLAQASMAPVADALRGLGIDILSSPGLGVRRAVTQLRGAVKVLAPAQGSSGFGGLMPA